MNGLQIVLAILVASPLFAAGSWIWGIVALIFWFFVLVIVEDEVFWRGSQELPDGSRRLSPSVRSVRSLSTSFLSLVLSTVVFVLLAAWKGFIPY